MVSIAGEKERLPCGPTVTVCSVGPIVVVVVVPGSVFVVAVVEVIVVVVLVDACVSCATTASTKSSAVSSSAATSPTVAQPPFSSAFAKAFSNAVSAFSMHSRSTSIAFETATAWHSSSAEACLPLALRFDAAHFPPLFVPPSGKAPTTASTNSSTSGSSAAASPTLAHPGFDSAFPTAFANAAPALARHAASRGVCFLAALAWQPTLTTSCLAAAFSLADRHLAAGVGFAAAGPATTRSEEHTSELQSLRHL